MRLSDFWLAMESEFGAAYARHLARDLVPGDFGDLTVEEALATGHDVRAVWLAVCRMQEVPQERWLGPDLGKKPGI